MNPRQAKATAFAPMTRAGGLGAVLAAALLGGCPQPNGDSSSSGGSSGGVVASSSAGQASTSAGSSSRASSLAVASSSAAASSSAMATSVAGSSTSGGTGFSSCGQASCPWPAEPLASAQNLSSVEGPSPNDFGQDLSGAHWNAATGTLWLVRNGGTGGSKAWALERDGANGWRVATLGGQRAEWTGLGDAEGITQVPLWGDQHVLVLAEGQDVLGHYDFSVGGTVTLVESWNFAAHVPAYNGDLGSEAVTFVPNAALAAGGFVNAQGQVDQATGGLGGLVMVGHQAGGDVYALDLGAGGGNNVRLAGRYGTANTETAALEWDEGTQRLLVWHGAGNNDLEVARLSSHAGAAGRVLDSDVVLDLPGNANHEGLAVEDVGRCNAGTRALFLTTDDGGDNALWLFSQFPCP